MSYPSEKRRPNHAQADERKTQAVAIQQFMISERLLDGIPGFFAWFALLFSVVCAIVFPKTMLAAAALVGLYTALRFALIAIANAIGLRRIRQWEQIDWHQKYQEDKTRAALAWDHTQHIVIIPNYKEPLQVLRRTLDQLKDQRESRRRITIVLAMEAAEENSEQKAQLLKREYEGYFQHFYYTIHPRGLPGEMQCKSANESWAARWIIQHHIQRFGYNMDHICVTTMDADTRFHPQYFFALTYWFAIDPERYTKFWQSPIRYQGNIWEINPLMRVVNAYATAIELAYLAAPWWMALPMSSYSLSLRLLHNSGNWDIAVIADEWHMYIKSYFSVKGKVRLQPIFLPFLADSTFGNTFWEAIKQRYQQTLRHAWGSKEVGYCIANMIRHPEVHFLKGLRLTLRIAHDILLAGAGWVIVTIGSQLPIILNPEIIPFQINNVIGNPEGLRIVMDSLINEPIWLGLFIAGILFVIMGITFWYQDVIIRPPRPYPLTVRERFLTLLSLPLLPLLTLVVVALPTLQAQTRLLLGIPLKFTVTQKG